MTYVRSLLCAVLSVLLFAASNASAQDCNQFDQTEFNTVTQIAETQLADLERLTNVALDINLLTPMDEQRANDLMIGYANNFWRAEQIAASAADLASSTQGAQGDGRVLTAFELLASRHEPRTIALALKFEKIHAGLVQGKIRRASVDLPQGAPDFMQQFNQEGQQLAFREGATIPSFQKLISRGQQEEQSFGGHCRAAASALGNLLVPTAQAAQAFPCVSPCAKKEWATCAICVAALGGTALSSWNEFLSCWNSSNTTWGRAWCLVKLVARLA